MSEIFSIFAQAEEMEERLNSREQPGMCSDINPEIQDMPTEDPEMEESQNASFADLDAPAVDEPGNETPRHNSYEEERQRRILRGRTVTMLRKYMRYSIETGRLPSLLGREFFRAKVTSYTVVTFEDRVIFVHDMEACLNRLDEFSREIIARHILQEHDQAETARLLNCAERTVRTYIPMALDLLSYILVEVGLLKPVVSIRETSCQGGENDQNYVTDCE